MIKLKAVFDDGEFKRAQARFPDLVKDIKLEAGQAIAKIIDEALRERVIPAGDQREWVRWYLSSLRWDIDEDRQVFDLQVEEDIPLEDIPAGRSLLWLQGSWRILNESSPWPLPKIPRIKGGVPGRAMVRPVSADEYEFHDQRVTKEMPKIKEWFKGQEIDLTADEVRFDYVPQVDVDFLVGRIEHGLGDFNRQPHFVYIRQQIERRFGR